MSPTIPDPACTCGHPRSEHAYVVVDGPCGARSDGCQKFSAQHDCLRDATPGVQHCISCHENGHTYVAHMGILGIEPRIDPFGTSSNFEMHAASTPDLPTTERQS